MSNTNDWIREDLEPVVKINLHLFLDKSASMKKDWDKTIEGVVEYFSGLQENNNISYKASLHTFADKSETVFNKIDLKDLDKEKIRAIRPDGVSTALFDAVGFTLSQEKDTELASLIIVFTDGKDNSSDTFTSKKLGELRNDLEKKGNFTFVFMGASPDVWEEGKLITGSQSQNLRSFAPQDNSIQLELIRIATNSYSMRVASLERSGSVTRSISDFYADTSEIKELKK